MTECVVCLKINTLESKALLKKNTLETKAIKYVVYVYAAYQNVPPLHWGGKSLKEEYFGANAPLFMVKWFSFGSYGLKCDCFGFLFTLIIQISWFSLFKIKSII